MSKTFLISLVLLAKAAERVLAYKKEMDEALDPPPPRPLSEEQKRKIEDKREERRRQEQERQQANLRLPPKPVQSPTRWVETSYGREPLFGSETVEDPQVLRRIKANERGSVQHCREYYAAIEQRKWGSVPRDMRRGLRVDRWGTTWEKNPQGRGWRELGSDDDYQIAPNSSW